MRSNEPWCSCTRYTRTHTHTHTHRHTHRRAHTQTRTHMHTQTCTRTHTHTTHRHAHTHTRTHTTCTQPYTKLTNLVFLAREDFKNVKRGDGLGIAGLVTLHFLSHPQLPRTTASSSWTSARSPGPGTPLTELCRHCHSPSTTGYGPCTSSS